MVARIVFDLDDIDAAFAELDARYLAGEAAAHAHTWSRHSRTYRRAQPARTRPATTPDLRKHRPPTSQPFEPGDLTASFGAMWDLTPELASTSRRCIG